jgi:hypothetical protein
MNSLANKIRVVFVGSKEEIEKICLDKRFLVSYHDLRPDKIIHGLEYLVAVNKQYANSQLEFPSLQQSEEYL